tara:strand:- start:211 stop:348 length:138 start_codon:yes stop_codon:yes gene_type:complete
MNNNNSLSRSKKNINNSTRKKREELSISASKCLKKETIEIVVQFT